MHFFPEVSISFNEVHILQFSIVVLNPGYARYPWYASWNNLCEAEIG
jgi:hypothetical protein